MHLARNPVSTCPPWDRFRPLVNLAYRPSIPTAGPWFSAERDHRVQPRLTAKIPPNEFALRPVPHQLCTGRAAPADGGGRVAGQYPA